MKKLELVKHIVNNPLFPLLMMIIAFVIALILAVRANFSASVAIHDKGNNLVEKYLIPKSYRYYSSSINITGSVAVVTAIFKQKEAK